MSFTLGAYGNCATDFKGTGLGACDITKFGDATGIVLFRKGWSQDIVDGVINYDLTAYTNNVKELRAFPLLDIYDFAQDTPESEKNTSSTGVMSEVRAGKPQFTFKYDKGGCFHKALYDKAGDGLWDIGIIFETGILLAVNADGTQLKGFNTGMFSVATFKLLQGTDRQSSDAMVQFLDTVEFNARHEFIPFDQVGDLTSVNGLIEASVTVQPVTPGTEINVRIVSGCNKDNVILDLDDVANFELFGSYSGSVTSVVYNASTGMYDLTLSSTITPFATIGVRLGDGTYNAVEDSLGNAYKGASKLVTV